MDIADISKKLGLADSKDVIRKATELRRLCDLHFNSSSIGVGEICKAIICLEMAASRFDVIFDRRRATKLSGMSDKAYTRSFNIMQNGLGVKNKVDIRELAIQFGCIRLIPIVLRGLYQYKERFIASLPLSRRASSDFTRPVFTAVAFFLCAKKQKLKVDKIKLIQLCGTSESEFSNVANSMKDLCYDIFGVSKEKDPREMKGNRDALPEKRKLEDGGFSSDEEEEALCYRKHKRMEHEYKEN
ncbi:origin of replication complex subunit 6-like isoform X2 [Impatiens glandulifera]|uniref:origin of replication complex subunit 6-like isoform X2 n=1 Tax=Impatiens glandulifera TaxID=253017 RepID=UPI001FB06D22|nr:origin of replication complex subunit 6-like isoform X2 [Impatiens glandulifera]